MIINEQKPNRTSFKKGHKGMPSDKNPNMRDIRFRAWDEYKKRMFEVKGMEQTPLGTWRLWDGEVLIEPIVLYLMQYTGLKDKNGREIYEGDIVTKSSMDNFGYEVYWHTNTARWRLSNPYRSGFTGINGGDMVLMCEVIGNIYENPELLE